MKKWIIVKLAATLLCVNSFALDRYEREEIDRVMTEIYDQAEHTEQFIGAWNKAQDLLQAFGGTGEQKHAKAENLRLRQIVECQDLNDEEKSFLFMRGLLCAAPGLLKMREQAEKFFLKIAYSHDWASALQRLWEVCRVQLMSSLDPIGVMQDEFPGGVRGWVTGVPESVHREGIFEDLCDLFQKITENSVQVDSFFREGKAYELAQYIINERYQYFFCQYEVRCYYASALGVVWNEDTAWRGPPMKRVRDLCDRWGVPQRKCSFSLPQALSWPTIASGLESVVCYTEFDSELCDTLFRLRGCVTDSLWRRKLERCDDEGVVKRICHVFRVRPDLKITFYDAFRDMLSESVQSVYDSLEMTPLAQVETHAIQSESVFQTLSVGAYLETAFVGIKAFGNDAAVKEYNRCVGVLQVAFPDLRCVANGNGKMCDLFDFIFLASRCDCLVRHKFLQKLCVLLQDYLNQTWDEICPGLFAEASLGEISAIKDKLWSCYGDLVGALRFFPKLKGLLEKYRARDAVCNAERDLLWTALDRI